MYRLRIERPEELRIRRYPNYPKARKAFTNAVNLNHGARITLIETESGEVIRESPKPTEGSSNEN